MANVPQDPIPSRIFGWHPWPIGDPIGPGLDPWLYQQLVPQLSKEVLVEMGRIQLEYVKAVNAAYGNYLTNVQTALQKSLGR